MTSSFPELEPHVRTIMDQLKRELPASLPSGLVVAPVGGPPYVVVYPDSGVIGYSRLALERDSISIQFYVHAVGKGPEQTMWVMDKARKAVLGFRPEVPNRVATRVLQTLGPQMLTSDATQSLGPMKRDLSTQPPVYISIAEFAFSSQPAATVTDIVAPVGTEYFGTDGANWPAPWAKVYSGTADVFNGRGRLTAPATAYQSSGVRTTSNPLRGELTCRYRFDKITADGGFSVSIDNTSFSVNSYRTTFRGGGVQQTDKNYTPQVGYDYRLRLRWNDTTFFAKIWGEGTPEPEEWTHVNSTATVPRTAGAIVISASTGDPTAQNLATAVSVDELQIAPNTN